MKDGTVINNLEQWVDLDVKDIFGKHLLREVNSTIITPGLGDVPLFAQKSELGKTMFQFKSFSAAATNRVLLSGIQRTRQGDLNAAIGLIMLVHMGALTGLVKMTIAGREITDDDLAYQKLLLDGIGRSGVSGLMGDMAIGLNPWTKTSRFAGAQGMGVLLGPTAGLMKDAIESGICRRN